MGKTGKKGGKRLKKKELAKMLMELFQDNPAEVYDIKRIFRDLKLDTHPAKLLCMDLLEDLAMDDYIKETEKLHFRLNTTGQVFEAIFNRKANGKNTVTPLDGGEPVLVGRTELFARHGRRQGESDFVSPQEASCTRGTSGRDSRKERQVVCRKVGSA